MGAEATLFDKIIRGEIPSHRVYEDDYVYAFLDIAPQSTGHTLVVPKESKAHVHELSEEAMAALGRALPKICRAVMSATGATSYNILQNNGADAGQSVFHVHFHIIPRLESQGLHFRWSPRDLTPQAAAELLKKMHASLSGSSTP